MLCFQKDSFASVSKKVIGENLRLLNRTLSYTDIEKKIQDFSSLSISN